MTNEHACIMAFQVKVVKVVNNEHLSNHFEIEKWRVEKHDRRNRKHTRTQ